MATTTTKKKTARKPTTRRTAKSGAKGTRRAAGARGQQKELHGAAKKAAEFLGMDPKDVAARADKLRGQTAAAGKKLRAEVNHLSTRANDLAEKFEAGMQDGVKKFEKLADEAVKGLGVNADQFAVKVESGLNKVGKEAQRLADEANAEVKKMYSQARERLTDLLKGHKPGPQ